MFTYSEDDFPRLPLSAFELWGKNYRRGNVQAIKKSIIRFGFNGALRVRFDGQTCTVYGGNHACRALLELKESGSDIPKGIVAEQTGDWLIPYFNISHLTLPECEAFAIADNTTSKLGSDDESALSALLAEIGFNDRELLRAASVDDAVVDKLLSQFDAPPPVPDFAPDPDAFQGSFGEEKKIQCPCCGEWFVAPK